MELETEELKAAEKLNQLDRILESRALHGSDYLKSFLKYVVSKSIETPGASLNEYTIATEVFGRRDDFRSRNDSVVRVQASRLRQRLEEYYASEGKLDRIRIELPKGHYHPVFSIFTPTEEAGKEQSTAVVPERRAAGRWTWLMASATLVLAFAVVGLGISYLNLSSQVASTESIDKYGPVWEPFLLHDNQTLLVLSNPMVYRFSNPKDPDILLKNSVEFSPEQAKYVNATVGDKFMVKNSPGGLILCTDEYTGMGEAIGLARITNLFRSAHRTAPIKQSRTISPEDLKNHNVVLLGSMWVNEWSGKLPIKEDFAHTSAATIVNIDPQPGEDREYGPRFDADGNLVEDYGLITVKPNISYKNRVMVLAGIHSEGTEAAAEYVTNPDFLEILSGRLIKLSSGSEPPKYYQALLKVAVDHGMPTTISLVTVHALRDQNE